MKNKSFRMKLAILFVALLVLASCGGGSSSSGGGGCASGADCVSFAFDGGAATVWTETANASASPAKYDPYIYSNYTNPITSIEARKGYKDYDLYNDRLSISIWANTTGTYPAKDSVYYEAASDAKIYTPLSGEIVVSVYDSALGGRIQGSFDVTFCKTDAFYIGPTCALSTRMTGTFNVTRDF
jgi:hypothetical protein